MLTLNAASPWILDPSARCTSRMTNSLVEVPAVGAKYRRHSGRAVSARSRIHVDVERRFTMDSGSECTLHVQNDEFACRGPCRGGEVPPSFWTRRKRAIQNPC